LDPDRLLDWAMAHRIQDPVVPLRRRFPGMPTAPSVMHHLDEYFQGYRSRARAGPAPPARAVRRHAVGAAATPERRMARQFIAGASPAAALPASSGSGGSGNGASIFWASGPSAVEGDHTPRA
jgi:hypothetical protein